jgi:glycerol-3-phosphate acyltransferase PlsY
MTGNDIISVGLAYLLGGICFGYYLVRLKCGVDIRDYGSGGVGARNVGRLLGKPGFIFVLLGDALKGVAAMEAACMLHAAPTAQSLVLVAVIAGHIWPLFLRFRGGRGIATAIGAYLAYDPLLTLLLLGMTGVLMIFRRGLILSGLAAFLFMPFLAFGLHFPHHSIAALTGSSIIILYAHRERIRKAFAPPLPTTEA